MKTSRTSSWYAERPSRRLRRNSTSCSWSSPAEPPLLELTGHRDQPVGRSRDVLARRTASPGVSARAAVGEDAAGDDQAVLVGGPKLGERLEAVVLEERAREVELGLHVGLVAVGADERRFASRAEQEADGLRQDRLAGAGLPGDGVQAGLEGELGVANEDEILDAKPAQHDRDGMRRACGRPSSRGAGPPSAAR